MVGLLLDYEEFSVYWLVLGGGGLLTFFSARLSILRNLVFERWSDRVAYNRGVDSGMEIMATLLPAIASITVINVSTLLG
jgi:hypothetical protein